MSIVNFHNDNFGVTLGSVVDFFTVPVILFLYMKLFVFIDKLTDCHFDKFTDPYVATKNSQTSLKPNKTLSQKTLFAVSLFPPLDSNHLSIFNGSFQPASWGSKFGSFSHRCTNKTMCHVPLNRTYVHSLSDCHHRLNFCPHV